MRNITKQIFSSTVLLLTAQVSTADPINLALQFEPNSGESCNTSVFHLDVTKNSDYSRSFTLVGSRSYEGSDIIYPAYGAALEIADFDYYPVSLTFTSHTGETFTFGGQLDKETLSGPGTQQRIAHGSVGSDCSGTWSKYIIPIVFPGFQVIEINPLFPGLIL